MRLIATLGRGVDVSSLKVKYLIDAASQGLKEGVSEAAFMIQEEAKLLCPVDTGALRDAIHTERVADTPTRQVLAVVPAYPDDNEYGFTPPYARRIEYGFVGPDRLGRVYHQAPHPYMRPALDGKRADATAAIRAAVLERVRAAHTGGL